MHNGHKEREMKDLPGFFFLLTPPTLTVVSVDMRLNANKTAHRTNSYINDNLIVRRGQEFIMAITFNRSYDQSVDEVVLEFLIGSEPYTTDTLIPIVLKSSVPSSWNWRIIGQQGLTTVLGITPSPKCIVGKFSSYLTVVTPIGKYRSKRNPDLDIYILFNAWNPGDDVFLNDESQRTEYVLNDQGIIFNGQVNNITSRPWNYGQFKRGVLDACLFVMNRSQMLLKDRQNVIKVVRRASAMINSNDDQGVIIGNWSNDYSMGTSPTSWTGSTEILLKYANTGLSVGYGQCWVFAGVFNTFMRCLGIPARVITCFNSAHDTVGEWITEIVVDERGTRDTAISNDSVWNFHCWNEAMMKRPDLPPGFNGWQVVDSTPQETSDGCGPASVQAVKNGLVYYPFDSPFVFDEVNSDLYYMQRDRYGNMTILYMSTTYVGQLIITKTIGQSTYDDVTLTYKYPEGSAEDDATMSRVEKYGISVYRTAIGTPDVELTVTVPTVKMGDSFTLTAFLNNTSDERRTVQVLVTGTVVFYTGVNASDFMDAENTVLLEAGQSQSVDFNVNASDYTDKLVDQGYLSFTTIGNVLETTNTLTNKTTIKLQVPQLSLTGQPEVQVQMFVTLAFTNVFGFTLENITARMEGPGSTTIRTKQYSGLVPGASLSWKEAFVPQKPGPDRVVASLDCEKVRQLVGELSINVAA
uniref:protein-glutamine gamma-glutamyltransferase n=1 Tax=Denticeps clupeoides TaxID=299321 RepID=A0AAY4DBX3_9TELE